MYNNVVPGLKEILDANKMAFENTYQAMCTVQNQAEEMSNMWLKQFNLAPQNLQNVQNDWLNLVKKERDNWKKTIDMGFQSLEKMFTAQTSDAQETKSASQKPGETTGPKKSEEKSSAKTEESGKKTAQEKAKSTA